MIYESRVSQKKQVLNFSRRLDCTTKIPRLNTAERTSFLQMISTTSLKNVTGMFYLLIGIMDVIRMGSGIANIHISEDRLKTEATIMC